MSLNTLEKIPFFKKRPILTSICVLLAGLLTFTILNLDKVIDFKLWLTGKDVTITLNRSVVRRSSPPFNSRIHEITYQILNTRKTPLVIRKATVIDWKTKKPEFGYTTQVQNNQPIKYGESRTFTISNYLLLTIPQLGVGNEITQGLKIETNFKTYIIPIDRYINYLDI